MTYRWQDHQVHWDKERVSRALLECDMVYRTELVKLTYDLNQYHGIFWTAAQYEKLIGYWLRTFVQLLYDRWHGCESGKPNRTPWDSRDAVDLLHYDSYHKSDSLNESLYWQLAALRHGGRLNRLPLPDRLSFSAGYEVLGGGRAPVQIHNPYHSYGIPAWRRYLTYSRFPRGLRRLASPIAFRPAPATSYQIDADWRLSRTGRRITDFPEACTVLVRVHAPALFLEGFGSMREAASRHHATCLYTANSHYMNTPFMYLSAEWHGRTRLLTHQHGGGFGLDMRNVGESHARAVSDCFYTWGWSEDPTTRPLPVPPRFRYKSPALRSGILLKCVNYPRYVYKIMYLEMAGANQALIQRTIRFAGALTEHDLEVSLYAHDYGWNVRRQFADARVAICECSRDHGKYALHVCNYLGTAWLETLAADVPTICFYDPDVYEFRGAALPFIEELKRVGILHESPDSASDMVKDVLRDPQKWWQTSEVQEARLAFVHRYARLEDGWLSAWTEEFLRTADLACESS
jgi:hypothetical protein